MERSEESLSTRDLAQPNEPAADRDAADSTGVSPEGGSVYDQERVGLDEPAAGDPAVDERGIGTRADAADGAAEAPSEAAVGAGGGSTTVQDDSVQRQPTDAPAGGAGVAGRAATDTADAGAVGAGTADAGAVGAGRAGGGAAGTATADGAGESTPLLSADASSSFQRRWEEVQTRFVDEPRGAVEEADGLVANLMQQLAEGFAQERERLEGQWDRGEDISTEDLRVALQRYRSFFQRLLSA